MFGRILNEGLGKLTFWTFYIGFHLTFFVQHFLGLWGMPRRVFTYLPDQGWDTANYISTIGAFLMGVGTIILLINIIMTHMKKADAPADPWDGRTLEWSIPSPPPEYNFKQTPLVRGLDAFWKEKMAGNKEMTPAEPLAPIHMPSPSILPFVMSLGMFIGGLGVMYANYELENALAKFLFHSHIVSFVGLAIILVCMFLRSVYDDHGFHIEVDELEDKGVKA